jgi:hypothetical protein|tara:strand:- start:36 stop:416 length:381 start_codon:yes stop_codon:yes gene_type:complete
MTEYQIFNMMYVGFISNSMYFVGCVLLIWLGFRMANNIYNSPDANMASKVFTSLFCVLVAMITYYTQQIGAAILGTAVTSLTDIGAASAERMVQYVDNPLTIGGTVQTVFVLVVLVFQLAITWSKK